MRTVLIVGAGRYQRAVIRRAQELGLRVVAVDRNPEAPGLREADVGRVVDFSKPENVLAAISDLEIHGVLTVQAEWAVPMVAAIAEELELPGIGAETAHLMTHKVAMRRRLAKAGVPQPRFTTLRTPAEARRAAEVVGFPAVLKPASASGQQGVFRVDSVADIETRLHDSLAVSPTEDAILEEFIDGTEMNGIVVAQDGEALAVFLSDRLRPPGMSFGISWIHLYPPSVHGAQLEEAERVAADTVRALELRTGIAFPQLLATRDGHISVVECAARIGGLMAELLRHAVGIDLLEVQIRIALGDEIPDELAKERVRQPVAMRFLTAAPGPLPTGRVTRVGTLEKVLAAPGVVDAALFVEKGETIRPVMRVSDRRGYVVAIANTGQDALERAEAAALLVDIDVESA